MKITVQLSEADLKQAVAEFMRTRGYKVDTTNMVFSTLIGDRPGDVDEYMVTASCEKLAEWR